MSLISKKVRDGSLALLSHGSIGFNPNFAAALASGNYPGVDALIIDFTATGTNFLFGNVDPTQLDDSGSFTYPLLMLNTLVTEDTRQPVGLLFGGNVSIGMKFVVDFEQSAPEFDFESIGDAIEDAMFKTWNSNPSIALLSGYGIAYPGNLNLHRGPHQFGGSNWRQELFFAAQCHYQTN